MAYEEITALLGGWPGFVVREVTRTPGGTQPGAVARAAEPDATRTRRRVIKGARWRNRSNLRRDERTRLKELLAANRRLWVVYVLKGALKALCDHRYPGAAQRARREWYGWAVRSRIPALVAFARKLVISHELDPGILASLIHLAG